MNAYDTAVLHSYAGLRAVGYSWLDALRALRTLGVSLAAAKAAHDTYNAKERQ